MKGLADHMTVKSLAEVTGVHGETIRYYERIGLLPQPARGGNGYRRYGQEDARRLGFIRRARDLGFDIEEIRSLLALERGELDCAAAAAIAAARLAETRARLAGLAAIERRLARHLDQCRKGQPARCAILEDLARPPSKY